jgi:iron complex transport system ATP-binding protein
MAIQISDEIIIMTPENIVQDQPCNLILKGSFDTLFQDEHINFDAEKGKFVIS